VGQVQRLWQAQMLNGESILLGQWTTTVVAVLVNWVTTNTFEGRLNRTVKLVGLSSGMSGTASVESPLTLKGNTQLSAAQQPQLAAVPA
jgi:hypothetical protein